MVDEIFDRSYQSGRAELHAGFDRGLATIGREFWRSLGALHRLQWAAPWDRRSKGAGCA